MHERIVAPTESTLGLPNRPMSTVARLLWSAEARPMAVLAAVSSPFVVLRLAIASLGLVA